VRERREKGKKKEGGTDWRVLGKRAIPEFEILYFQPYDFLK
jgi:hypothetical protein